MKTTVRGLKGRKQIYHAIYDFSVDGGVKDVAIDLFDLKAGTIIHDFWAEVETAVVGTSSTIEVGVTGGDTDGYLTQMAEATAVADYVTDPDEKGALLYDSTDDHDMRLKLTTADSMSLLIGTANLTAGKVHFYVEASDGY